MGLFGFGKKKEPVPNAEYFLNQRLDAAGADAVYQLMRQDLTSVVENWRWSEGSTSFSRLTIDGGEYDLRSLGKRLRINEEGMDPIPAKQPSYYYSLSRWTLLDLAARKGSAKAAVSSFFSGMMNNNEESARKAEELLKFGCGELGEKYAEILMSLKKNMKGTAADATQQESYVVTACHVLRQTDLSQLDEYHRSVYDHAHEILSEEEYEVLAFFAGYALFCMGNRVTASNPSATCRLGTVLSTGDKSYFEETYGMKLNVSENMLTLANLVVDPVVRKAQEGDFNCANACRLWGVA